MHRLGRERPRRRVHNPLADQERGAARTHGPPPGALRVSHELCCPVCLALCSVGPYQVFAPCVSAAWHGAHCEFLAQAVLLNHSIVTNN